MFQPVDKPVEMCARPGSSLVKCGQMGVKVTLVTPILIEMKDKI